MAYTAHKDEESIKEHFDSPEVLAEKVDKLVALIRKSKHFVVFTGAGISTSAGIPDFRGPEGKWTLEAQGRTRTAKTTDSLSAIPTATHMSLVELVNRGILKYIISQNCDGLHRRSGIPPEKISELHGNGNIEFCETCGHEYLRDSHCYRIKRGSKDHFTGRYCVLPNCGGRLMNSTIDFGQNLPVRPLQLAGENSLKADLHLAMGSSLTVNPACTMPKKTAKHKGKLVIVNLQKTPLDHLAHIRIFHKTDVVMTEVMKRLGIEIPPFLLRRNFAIDHALNDKKWDIALKGFDYGTDGSEIPATLVKAAQILLPPEFEPNRKHLLKQEPFRVSATMACPMKSNSGAIVRLHMMGHYAEPPLDVILNATDSPHALFHVTYNPMTGEWKQRKLTDDQPDMEEDGKGEKEKEREHSGKGKEKEKEKEDEDEGMMVIEPTVKVSSVVTRGDVPRPGKWAASAVALGADGKPMLVTFGGSGIDRSMVPITCLDLQSLNWQVHMDQNDEGTFVSERRWGHSATVVPGYDSSNVFLIGGWDSKCQYNDVHIYDCKDHSLTTVKTTGTPPGFRAGHTALAVEKNIVVFGGAICEGGPYRFYNDAFVYDTEKSSWRQLKCTGDVPIARAQHAAVILGKDMVVVGGFTGDSVVNDIHVLDLVTLQWTRVDAKGNLPPSQKGIHMSDFRVHPARHTLTALRMSAREDSTCLAYVGPNGVYLLNPANWTWTKPADDEDSKASVGGLLKDGLYCHSACDIGGGASVVLLGGDTKEGENRAVLSVSLC